MVVGKTIVSLKQEIKRSVEPLMAEINKIQQEKATMEQVEYITHVKMANIHFVHRN